MKTLPRIILNVLLMAAWTALPAQTPHAPVRVPVTDARVLLIAAIDSPDGTAQGVLTGATANAITQRFGAASPIYIDVVTGRRYRQTGCSRLTMTLWQEGVLLPGAATPRRQTIEIGIDYCRDGAPPRSRL